MIALRARHLAHRIVNAIRFPEVPGPPPLATRAGESPELIARMRGTYVRPRPPFFSKQCEPGLLIALGVVTFLVVGLLLFSVLSNR